MTLLRHWRRSLVPAMPFEPRRSLHSTSVAAKQVPTRPIYIFNITRVRGRHGRAGGILTSVSSPYNAHSNEVLWYLVLS